MRNPRSAAAAFIRERAPAILPRVVEEATAGESSDKYAGDLQRRLTAYLERRIPPWLEALEASNSERPDAIRRLLRTDAEAVKVWVAVAEPAVAPPGSAIVAACEMLSNIQVPVCVPPPASVNVAVKVTGVLIA